MYLGSWQTVIVLRHTYQFSDGQEVLSLTELKEEAWPTVTIQGKQLLQEA